MLKLTATIDDEYYEKEYAEDPEQGLELEHSTTERGFEGWRFRDRYGQFCSLQNSSLATEGAIWFGVENTGPNLDGPSGKRNEQIMARMHLTRKQIQDLLPILHEFAEKGYVTKENVDARN